MRVSVPIIMNGLGVPRQLGRGRHWGTGVLLAEDELQHAATPKKGLHISSNPIGQGLIARTINWAMNEERAGVSRGFCPHVDVYAILTHQQTWCSQLLSRP